MYVCMCGYSYSIIWFDPFFFLNSILQNQYTWNSYLYGVNKIWISFQFRNTDADFKKFRKISLTPFDFLQPFLYISVTK